MWGGVGKKHFKNVWRRKTLSFRRIVVLWLGKKLFDCVVNFHRMALLWAVLFWRKFGDFTSVDDVPISSFSDLKTVSTSSGNVPKTSAGVNSEAQPFSPLANLIIFKLFTGLRR